MAPRAGTEPGLWRPGLTAGPHAFTVWLDGQRIQRFGTVHHGSGRAGSATRTETVELWDYGVPVDDIDWTRLPAFRTPGAGIPAEGEGQR